jgi:hypothetical protein
MGVSAQLQKSGGNIRSGVVQRAIAITERRQVHSADFSSGGPSDGAFGDPLRSDHAHGKRDAEEANSNASIRRRLSSFSGLTNFFGGGQSDRSGGVVRRTAGEVSAEELTVVPLVANNAVASSLGSTVETIIGTVSSGTSVIVDSIASSLGLDLTTTDDILNDATTGTDNIIDDATAATDQILDDATAGAESGDILGGVDGILSGPVITLGTDNPDDSGDVEQDDAPVADGSVDVDDVNSSDGLSFSCSRI